MTLLTLQVDTGALALAMANEMRGMSAAPVMAAPPPLALPTAKPPPIPFGLHLEVHETNHIAGSFSSWFDWGMTREDGTRGRAGAAHSVEAWPGGYGWKSGMDRSQWPLWTQQYRDDEIIIRPGNLDAALFGVVLPSTPPPAITRGGAGFVRGYPAGTSVSEHYEIRGGTFYMDRPEDMRGGDAASWIFQQADGTILVMPGMSGGVCTALVKPGTAGSERTTRGDEIAVGILVTQNSRADLDGDGDQDHSCDVVELADVWDVLINGDTAHA